MPRDVNRLAFRVVELATNETPPARPNRYAKSGRLGGLRGGVARAKALSKRQRSEIARRAARARWRPQP